MILIIDGNYLCHKTRFGMHNVSLSNDDIHTEVVFGFLQTLLKISKRFSPDNWAFVWDSKKSFREIDYPQYKENRKKLHAAQYMDMTDEEREINQIQYNQFEVLRKQVLTELGFVNNYLQVGIEGDDLIAKITQNNHIDDFLIVSTDKDLYQLLDTNVAMYSEHTKKVFDLKEFKKMYYNMDPKDWGIAKAIGGCMSDDVPGVYGCADPGKSVKSRAIQYIIGTLPHGTIKTRIESDIGQHTIERNKNLVVLPYKRTRDIEVKKQSLFARDFRNVFTKFGFESFLRHGTFREWDLTFKLC